MLIVYVLLYGWILISSEFVPNVMHGNESYSSLLQAYNLYNFDITRSVGLTDEAASPDTAAHPFNYTHQGNFPRMFAYLIYLLGARNIESQIVVTTFTVGLAGIVFGFVFFCRISGPLFALTVSLLLMTDYLLFTQWQVVTYRVWYGFFMFSSLLCAQGIGRSRRKLPWAMLMVLNHLCLFYSGLISACFTAVTTWVYTAWAHRRTWKTVALVSGAQVAGAAIGLFVFATQVILYLGWDGFLQDLFLTFMARSYASNDPGWLQKLMEFYNTHNIVFWYNLRSADEFKTFGSLLHSVFSSCFLIHTPFLTLIVLLVFTGWLAGIAASWTRRLRILSSRDLDKEVKALVAFAFLVAFGLFIVLLKFVIEDLRLAGGRGSNLTMPLSGVVLLAILSLPLVGYMTMVFVRQALNAFSVDGSSPSVKLLVTGLYLCGAFGFVSLQSLLYKQEWRILWADTLGPSNQWIALTVASVAVMVGLFLIVLTPDRVLYRGGTELKGIIPFLTGGLFAFLVVYKVSPGYVHSGYLELHAPLVVFHVDTLFATSLFILLSAGRSAYTKLRTACSLRQAALVKAWGTQPAFLLVGSLGLTGYFLLYWIEMQVAYVQLFPYNSFTFMKMLRETPYRGSSFVVNTYAGPIFTYTGQWTYYDSEIGKGIVRLTSDGFEVRRDLLQLWFADRHTRLDYLKPDYFLCVTGRTFQMIIDRLTYGSSGPSGCGNVELVKQAALNTAMPLRHRLVDQDDSPDNAWAVVKLDWDFPPYLDSSLSGNGGTAVQLAVDKTSSGWVAVVSYRYRHQEGLPEGDTQVRLFAMERKAQGATEAQGLQQTRLIAEGIRQRRFNLPRHFKGLIQATVSPATSTKIGYQYASEPIWIGLNENRGEQRDFY